MPSRAPGRPTCAVIVRSAKLCSSRDNAMSSPLQTDIQAPIALIGCAFEVKHPPSVARRGIGVGVGCAKAGDQRFTGGLPPTAHTCNFARLLCEGGRIRFQRFMAGVTKAVEGITVWRLIWTGLLGAIAVTEVVVAAMSELLLGRVTVEYLTIGLVAAFVTSLVVLPLLSHFVIQVRTSRDILLRSRELILAEEKYREGAEQALRASEERYRRVSSVISDIAFSCRAADSGEYAIDWLTGATERITGYSPDELKAKGCWGSIVVEDDRARFDEHVAGLAPGSSGSCELQVRHKDGSVRWLASWVECVLYPTLPI